MRSAWRLAARGRAGARRLRAGRGGGVVLLYHRVAAGPDPFLLNVSEANFAQHLDVLRSLAEPCPVAELVDETPPLRPAGRLRAAVTFDDGYADNLHAALPLLERQEVPATVFVATGLLDGGRAWWDELASGLRGADDSAPWWNVESAETPSLRHAQFKTLATELRTASQPRREAALAAWCGPPARPHYAFLTSSELLALAASRFVEIGAHTIDHPVLASLSADRQEREVGGSRDTLERVLGRPVGGFAYPFGTTGDYTRVTVRAVRRARLSYACANIPGLVGRFTSRFEIPRFVVRDWDGEEFERRLRRFAQAGRP